MTILLGSEKKCANIFNLKADVPASDRVLKSLAKCSVVVAGQREKDIPSILQGCFEAGIKNILHLPNAGTFHIIYQVTNNNDELYFVKTPNPKIFAQDFGPLIDLFVRDSLKGTGFPVPPIQKVDITGAVVPYEFMVSQKAEGVSLATRLMNIELSQTLLEDLACKLINLHQLSGCRAGLIDMDCLYKNNCLVGVNRDWQDYISLNLDKHIRFCYRHGFINNKEKLKIKSILMQFLEKEQFPQISLLHGDLNNQNIFFTDDTVTAIIDWEDALLGDPIFDVAMWATFNPVSYYKGVICKYLELSGMRKQEFYYRFWVYYLRIALSKTVHRHRFSYPDQNTGSKASARIQRALSCLDQMGNIGSNYLQ